MPSHSDLKQAILGKLDFRSFYEKYLQSGQTLKPDSPDGWSNRVLCPIHQDKDTPNFFANLKNGSFKCQACGEGGSVFDFWLIKHNYNVKDKKNFRHALEALAVECGIQTGDYKPDAPAKPITEDKPETEPGCEQYISKGSKADSNDKTKVPITQEYLDSLQQQLRRDHYVFLNQRRGLKKQTIDDAKIGFDGQAVSKHPETEEWVRGRYAIPVFDKDGNCRNIRLYSPIAASDYKMINYVRDKDGPREERFGQPVRLFQLHRLISEKWQNVVICEGEWDCLLLNQMFRDSGFSTWGAVTGTHGANTFEHEWVEYLLGKNVYFCYDCDEAGKSAAVDHVNKFFLPYLRQFAGVYLVELPLDGSKESKDITDYFLKAERTCDDFIKLCTETPEVIHGGLANDEACQEAVEVPDFVSAIKDRRYIDKRIRVPITISGATSKVYHAIRSYSVVRCPLMDKKDGAEACCSSSNTERTIPYGHPLFIEACMEREYKVLQSIAFIACQKDEKCKVAAIQKVVMEEYFAHQVVDRWRAQEDDEGRLRNAQELVQTSVYILQPANNIEIQPQNYIATGYIRTHPKTSVATFFIEQMVPRDEDWKKFTVESLDNQYILKTLQNDFTLEEILKDLTCGVTYIYEMDEILLGVLLTYLTPLWIKFNGNLQRGWINAAIIGDSGTGKSKTYMRFSDWVETGDLFSALSGTRTGLLYAIKKKNDEWQVSIGRYVQASGKIIAIDEMQEMSAEEIKRMAVAMDTGYLQVDQVASGGYHTQTRGLLLLNPKDVYGKAATISDFTFGCDALRMCFDPMFIRRLDFAVFTTANQNHEFYNRPNSPSGDGRKIRLTPRMMRTLIYWAWTRRADQVIWKEEATKACLEIASKLSQEFGHADQVPLVNPQDTREKLARMSVAYAILDRNFTSDLESVIVDVPHVQFIANFLDRLYSTPACNLRHKSSAVRQKNSLDDFDKIKEAFEKAIESSRNSPNTTFRQGDYLLRMLSFLQTMSSFRKRDLAEQLNVNLRWVTKRILIFQSYNLIDLGRHGGYRTTRKFNLFIQKWRQDQKVEAWFAEVNDLMGKQALQQADSLAPFQGVQQDESYYQDDPFSGN